MPLLNTSQAAKATGKDRRTIQRHAKSGKLSVAERRGNQNFFDTAELDMRYGLIAAPDAVQNGAAVPHLTAPNDVAERGRLEERCKSLEAQLNDMTAQRDAWQTQAERLAIPPPQKAEKAAQIGVLTRGWRWLFGTGDQNNQPAQKAVSS